MPEINPIPHADVPIGGTKIIKLVALNKSNQIIPGAIFSEVSYLLDNQVGNIVPNPDNPGIATFTGLHSGNANLLVNARVTIP